MKIYLDDVRPIPEGWVGCRWPNEVIVKLQNGGVTHLSLDHDLGDDKRGTGYDVLLWLEEKVAVEGFVPPKYIIVHSANVSAYKKMQLAIERIRDFRRSE